MSTRTVTVTEFVLHYVPSRPLAIVGAIAFAIAGGFLMVPPIKRKERWGLCLPIGAFCMGIGYVGRVVLVDNLDSIPLFAIAHLFNICSPAAFLAFNYIVFGRFIALAGAHHCFIRPDRMATIFVWSDIITFVIQLGGGSLQAVRSIADVGSKCLLIGLILQTASYFFFLALVGKAHFGLKKEGHAGSLWWKGLYVLEFSSLFIAIRCIFRVIELAQGNGGYLLTREGYFYGLDALPLLVAICIYIPYWPGKYLYDAVPEEYKMADSMRTSPA